MLCRRQQLPAFEGLNGIEILGGVSSNQIQSHKRNDGVTEIIYRKTLAPTSDPHDNEIYDDKATSVVWAIGRLAQKDKRQKEPSYHHTYTRRHTTIDFGRKETKNECLPFVQRKPGSRFVHSSLQYLKIITIADSL